MSPLLIAHRGASATWPEHTRAAYLQALADGADGLECDVRLTADGVAVCWHDATVDRTTDGAGAVLGHTLADLRGLRHRGAVPPVALGRPDEQVLTLAELVALAVAAGRPLVLSIELKHPSPYGWAAERAVLEVLAAAGWDGRTVGDVRVSLMSFHPGSLSELARLGVAPDALMQLLDVPAGYIADGLTAAETATLLAAAQAAVDTGAVGGAGPSVAYVRSCPERVAAWHAAGRVLRVWTVDTADDLAACVAAGVGEITTNDPAGLRRGPAR
jgi:glycerophosphoryl diester phosphodiesterase